MIKNKLIIMPLEGQWQHSADFFKQTALELSKNHQVIIYDQNHANFFLKKPIAVNYPQHINIIFHQVKYFLPGRRLAWIEKINRYFSFCLLLHKYRNVEKVLWIFYPNFYDFAKIKMKKMISLYDCVDYSEDIEKEAQLINSVDNFFVNSLTLKRLHKNAPKKSIYIDSQGFFLPDEKKIPKNKIKKDKPIIGFVGGINYRLDFSLLDKLIGSNPQWQFVFYGPRQKDLEKDLIYQTDSWLKKIKKYQNVTFGESKNRYDVYGLIKNFDVAIIPYNIKIAFNKYCYPMKVFEYLYFGKPIVGTEIEELKLDKFKRLVKIANSNQEFETAIKKILFKKLQPNQINKIRKLPLENSWQLKIDKILNTISNQKSYV